MEILIKGEGEVEVRFIDRKGRTIIQEKYVVSGSDSVQAKREAPLVVETTDGQLPLAPVLVNQSNPRQEVAFDCQKPAAFTRARCREIGCPPDIAEDAERGCAGSIETNKLRLPLGGQ